MKIEYKERVLENLNGIENKVQIVLEMLEGKRPANQKEAMKLVHDLKQLVENSRNIVDIS
jgi:hypothetical protein